MKGRYLVPLICGLAILSAVISGMLSAQRGAPGRTAEPAERTQRLTKGDGRGLSYATSWLGNSFSGPAGWVQHSIEAVAVGRDGAVYTNSEWDEGGREAGIYKAGEPAGIAGFTHGWGCRGGRALAVNDSYLFLAMRMDNENGALVNPSTWPPMGKWWYGISRRPIGRPSAPAPFASGKGGASGTLSRSFAIVNETPEGTNGEITGMAATSDRLYVSNSYTNTIDIYDPNSMARVGSFAVSRPGKIALGHSNDLWVISYAAPDAPAVIFHYSTSGNLLPGSITDVDDPRDVAVDFNGYLLVADAGPAQQILKYDVTNQPARVGSFGAHGGIYSDVRGEHGDLRLVFPAAVATDPAGNVYVAGGVSGADFRKFSPSGDLVWRILGLQFVDCVAADPATDAESVYSKLHRFSLDFTRTAGREWTLKATTVDRFQYPNDPRISESFPSSTLTAYAIRRLGGRKFLFLVGDSTVFMIYRFEGEIAVPSVIFASKLYGWLPELHREGRFIWRDVNGDGDFQRSEFADADGITETDAWGWDVDEQGDVWQAREKIAIWRFYFRGLDAAGNPVYSRAGAVRIALPPPFTAVERIKYIAETDTMFLSGYTAERPKAADGYWGQAGTEIARYDGWSAGNRTPRYRIALPYNPPVQSIKAFTVAGNRIFAGILNSAGSAQSPLPRNLFVYDADRGDLLGEMTPGPEIGSAMGWIDIGQGLHAVQRRNGEYVVFMEEVAFGKTIFYRIRW